MKGLLQVENLMDGCREVLSDISTYICDYAHGYICDVITQLADSQVDIYTYDLLEWAKDNYEYVEEAVDELGPATDSNGRADFLGMIRMGQYLKNERDLYDDLRNMLLFYVYHYILRDLEIHTISEEQNDALLEWDFDDNNETFENLIEHIENIFVCKGEE